MYELFFLVLLIAIVVLSMRRGKPAVDSPLIIEQAGRYHITLAPHLEGAQTFIEKVAEQLAMSPPTSGELPSLFFEVRDPNVSANSSEFYLLAVAYRGGVFYAQVINPQPLLRDADSYLKQVQAFSEAVMVLHPTKHLLDDAEVKMFCRMLEITAHQMNIIVTRLVDHE